MSEVLRLTDESLTNLLYESTLNRLDTDPKALGNLDVFINVTSECSVGGIYGEGSVCTLVRLAPDLVYVSSGTFELLKGRLETRHEMAEGRKE